jgi:hypothetical protein
MIRSVLQRQSGRFRIWSIQLGESRRIDPQEGSFVTHHPYSWLAGWLAGSWQLATYTLSVTVAVTVTAQECLGRHSARAERVAECAARSSLTDCGRLLLVSSRAPLTKSAN